MDKKMSPLPDTGWNPISFPIKARSCIPDMANIANINETKEGCVLITLKHGLSTAETLVLFFSFFYTHFSP